MMWRRTAGAVAATLLLALAAARGTATDVDRSVAGGALTPALGASDAVGLDGQPDGGIVATGAAGRARSRDAVPAQVAAEAASCGDGVVDAGETCDHGARNGAPDTCCDATCALRAAGATCRASLGACDPEESCDGASAHCPDDIWAHAGAPCRDAAGACDVAETCSGDGPECPRDAVRGVGAVCRVASGACDLDEKCDGEAPQCPDDRKSTAVCRSPRGGCDGEEWCDGVSNDCPADVLLADGSACEDGSACTVDDVCVDGICLPGPTDPDACSGYLCSTVKRVTVLTGTRPTAYQLGDTSGALRLRAARQVCEPVLTGALDSGVEHESTAAALVAARPSYAAYGATLAGARAAKRKQAAAGGRAPWATLSDQFGALEVGLEPLSLVSVPAATSTGADASTDALAATRYECHAIAARALGDARTPAVVSVRVARDDVARRFALRSPQQVCRAAGAARSVDASDDLLVCYGVKALPDETRPAASALVVQNPFETWLVHGIGQQHLCVPAVATSRDALATAFETPEPRKRKLERKRRRLAEAGDPDPKPGRKRPKEPKPPKPPKKAAPG